ncbi:MAG: ATP-binding protein [Kineosporiaceae bacterium]
MTELVRLVRARGTDLRRLEVKAASGGLPKSVRETVSAFSNVSGGVIVLGLDERAGFTVVPGLDVVRMRDALDAACADELSPPVRAEIDIEEVDGHPVVVARVPELDPRHKPCFVKARGEYAGSYIRGGDGDRRMTEYEIALLHANRGQPSDDRDAVTQARLEDLNPEAVRRLLTRLRQREPVAFPAGLPDEQALTRIGVLVDDGTGRAVPSLAGLLALGEYPQQFFPQLNVAFIAVPATSKDSIPLDGPRFLDNRTISGPIPAMVEETVSAIVRNMATRAHVTGVGRHDTYEYPVEALREAVTNALMHRDYGPYARGTQVQVEMYSDRLVVRNPGGLFGTVTEDDLGAEGVSSSRNAVLARLLQDVTLPGTDQVVCENRGTGIPAMIHALRRAGLTTPQFDDALTRFKVTIPKHALLDEETLAWLAGLHQSDLTDAQRMALALMREGRHVSNATLRQLGLDRTDATAALTGLVARGLAVSFGGRRYAQYTLAVDPDEPGQLSLPITQVDPDRHPQTDGSGQIARRDRTLEIDALFDTGRTLTIKDVTAATGLKSAMAARYLARLIDTGRIRATAPPRSKNRAYRRT